MNKKFLIFCLAIGGGGVAQAASMSASYIEVSTADEASKKFEISGVGPVVELIDPCGLLASYSIASHCPNKNLEYASLSVGLVKHPNQELASLAAQGAKDGLKKAYLATLSAQELHAPVVLPPAIRISVDSNVDLRIYNGGHSKMKRSSVESLIIFFNMERERYVEQRTKLPEPRVDELYALDPDTREVTCVSGFLHVKTLLERRLHDDARQALIAHLKNTKTVGLWVYSAFYTSLSDSIGAWNRNQEIFEAKVAREAAKQAEDPCVIA